MGAVASMITEFTYISCLQYVDAFKSLAKTSNTVLLPEKTGDVSSMVAQVCLYKCVWGEGVCTYLMCVVCVRDRERKCVYVCVSFRLAICDFAALSSLNLLCKSSL